MIEHAVLMTEASVMVGDNFVANCFVNGAICAVDQRELMSIQSTSVTTVSQLLVICY